MISTATTALSVYRGTTTNVYGDTVDNNITPVHTGIPASLVTQTKTVTRYDQDTPRIVRFTIGRVPMGSDIRTGDRVKDERTATVYLVDSTTGASVTPAYECDLHLDLRQVSAL